MSKLIVGVGLLAIVATIAYTAPELALAYQGDPTTKGPNYTQERHAVMTKAFETNDYAAWKANMSGRGQVTKKINEQNFPKFAQAHKLALEGKTEEANSIRAELGLGLKNGSGNGQGMRMGSNH